MTTRDQQRAILAFQHIQPYAQKPERERKKYATIVHKLPALLQSAGLCQALHFVQSREEHQRPYLDHLATQLSRCLGLSANQSLSAEQLLERVRRAALPEYLQLTDEAMACAAWYRRLVQGVLKIEASAAEETT